MENAKIQEAMVRACAKQLSAIDESGEEEYEEEEYDDEDDYGDDEDDYDEDYYNEDYDEDLDYAGTSFRFEMEEALVRWAEALSGGDRPGTSRLF